MSARESGAPSMHLSRSRVGDRYLLHFLHSFRFCTRGSGSLLPSRKWGRTSRIPGRPRPPAISHRIGVVRCPLLLAGRKGNGVSSTCLHRNHFKHEDSGGPTTHPLSQRGYESYHNTGQRTTRPTTTPLSQQAVAPWAFTPRRGINNVKMKTTGQQHTQHNNTTTTQT